MDLDTLWDFGSPQVSEARFRDALAAAAGEDAQVLRTQLARALGLQGRFAEAHEELRQVAASTPLVRTHLELERGRLVRSAEEGDPVPHFECALADATAAGIDHLAVDAAHMLALTHEGAEQIPAAERALELARASDDPRARRWVASVTHNLGWTMHELGRHAEALALWEEALRARQERFDHEGESQAEPLRIARWTVARGLRELGRRDEALTIQRALKHEGPPDEYVDQELAELTR